MGSPIIMADPIGDVTGPNPLLGKQSLPRLGMRWTKPLNGYPFRRSRNGLTLFAIVAQKQSGCLPDTRPRWQNPPIAPFYGLEALAHEQQPFKLTKREGYPTRPPFRALREPLTPPACKAAVARHAQ